MCCGGPIKGEQRKETTLTLATFTLCYVVKFVENKGTNLWKLDNCPSSRGLLLNRVLIIFKRTKQDQVIKC